MVPLKHSTISTGHWDFTPSLIYGGFTTESWSRPKALAGFHFHRRLSGDDDAAERVFENALVVHDLASDPGGRRELGPGLVGDHPERILCEHRVVVDGGDRVGFATSLMQFPDRSPGRALSNSEQFGHGTTGYGRQVPGHGDFQVANLIVRRMLADVVHVVTVEGDRALGLGTGQTNLECGAPGHLGLLRRFDPADLLDRLKPAVVR